MKSTFLILTKRKGEENAIVHISGPFFREELDINVNQLEIQRPDLIISTSLESSFRRAFQKEYEESFMTRPLFFLETLLLAHDLGGYLTMNTDMTIVYSNLVYIQLKGKNEVAIGFSANCPARTAGEITLKIKEYIISGIKISISPTPSYEPRSTRGLVINEFAAQLELLEFPVSPN